MKGEGELEVERNEKKNGKDTPKESSREGMVPKEHIESYNMNMVGRNTTVVTRREQTSGDDEMEEAG